MRSCRSCTFIACSSFRSDPCNFAIAKSICHLPTDVKWSAQLCSFPGCPRTRQTPHHCPLRRRQVMRGRVVESGVSCALICRRRGRWTRTLLVDLPRPSAPSQGCARTSHCRQCRQSSDRNSWRGPGSPWQYDPGCVSGCLVFLVGEACAEQVDVFGRTGKKTMLEQSPGPAQCEAGGSETRQLRSGDAALSTRGRGHTASPSEAACVTAPIRAARAEGGSSSATRPRGDRR